MGKNDRMANTASDQTTADEIVTESIMVRASRPEQSVLIVEGRSDLTTYKHLFGQESCRIIPSYSKDKAIQILEILSVSKCLPGVLGIVDADFSRLEGEESRNPNLFETDCHDLEMMILKSPALEKLLDWHGSNRKREAFAESLGKPIREVLFGIGYPIGCLRWISQKKSLSLKFECRDGKNEDIREKIFGKFIDYKSLTIDIDLMIVKIRDRSGREDLAVGPLRSSIDTLVDAGHDSWDVCCGHDLACILHFALRKVLGSHDANEFKSRMIEAFLSGAYELRYFYDTKLYESLREWERDNTPFRIFSTT